MPKYNGDTIQAKMCAGVDTDDELNIIRTSDDGAVHTYLNGQEAAIEVEGTVSVDNFPATQDVNIASQDDTLVTDAPETTTHPTGVKLITTGGTGEALVASSTPANWVCVTPHEDNTGLVYVGNSTAQDYPIPSSGFCFKPEGGDLANVYIDSAEDGEGVAFIYGT